MRGSTTATSPATSTSSARRTVSIFEFKCYTTFHVHVALGLGSRRCGGAASTSDGNSFAFGNTEELLRSTVLGLVASGLHDDEPLDRRTGIGRVAARSGDYADAISKGTTVHLLATESSGALSSSTVRLLRALAKRVASPEGHDATVYGTGRASPKSFVTPPPPVRHLCGHCVC